MDEKTRKRLRRLGVVRLGDQKGHRQLKPALATREIEATRSDSGRVQSLVSLLPGGRLEEAAGGACFVLDQVYRLDRYHGSVILGDLHQFHPAPMVPYGFDTRLSDLEFGDLVFLDTETTGLAGAGTLAFMVGVAFFESNPGHEALVVRQFFLRDHGDEPAMLSLLQELLQQKQGVVTFNGRSFDLPLLDGRYLLNRMAFTPLDLPHIDLLPPSRRLWRRRIGSCALSSLEKSLLGVQRRHEDVPGWLIPSLYQNYLRTGDAWEIVRVFYHNEVDLVSMVTLAKRLVSLIVGEGVQNDPVDLLSLGLWQAHMGMTVASEASLRQAAAGDLPLDDYHVALEQLGALLKRDERREEAVTIWQQLASTSFDRVDAHVELAKHFEWQDNDVGAALVWTRRALALVETWGRGSRDWLLRQELEHRQERLLRKIGDQASPDGTA